MFIRTNFISIFIGSLYSKGFHHKYRHGTRKMRAKIPRDGHGNRGEGIGSKGKLITTLLEAQISICLKGSRRSVMEVFKGRLEHSFTSVDDCPVGESGIVPES